MAMSTAKSTGPVIGRIRKKKGITQDDLARRVNVSRNFLSLIENGKREPSSDCLGRIAKELGVPPAGIEWLSRPRPTGLSASDSELYDHVDALVGKLIARHCN